VREGLFEFTRSACLVSEREECGCLLHGQRLIRGGHIERIPPDIFPATWTQLSGQHSEDGCLCSIIWAYNRDPVNRID
jgi:hypothetical protein